MRLPAFFPGGPRLGSVTLFDGLTGQALQTWWGSADGERFGQALSGGCLQNGLLLNALEQILSARGFEIIGNLIVGDPEHCAEKIVHHIRTLGITHLNCFMQVGGLPIGRALKSMERFAAEVVPLVERELGPLDRLGTDRTPDLAAMEA